MKDIEMTTIPSLKEQARRLGYTESYFNVLKKLKPDTFNYYLERGDGIVMVGYLRALEEVESLKIKVQAVYFRRHDERTMTKLMEKMVPEYFKSLTSAYSIFKRIWRIEHKQKELEKKINMYKAFLKYDKELQDAN